MRQLPEWYSANQKIIIAFQQGKENPLVGDFMGDFRTSSLGEPDLGIESHLTPRAGGTPTIPETANLLELAEAHSCCEYRIY
jgi:hypothetical protein